MASPSAPLAFDPPSEAGTSWTRVRDTLGPALVLLAAFVTIVLVVPAEGRVSVPLHLALVGLLGHAAFMLPLALALVGLLLVIQRVRPAVRLPRGRLLGVGLVAVGVLAAEHLLGADAAGTGLVGRWLGETLVDLVGMGGAVFGLMVLLAGGTWLAFDVELQRQHDQPAAPDRAAG